MELQVDNLVQKWMDRLSLLMAIAVGVTALTVLAGWQWKAFFFGKSQPGWEAMNPVAALCFILSVISLLLIKCQPNSASKKFGSYILAGCVFFAGILRVLKQIPAFPFHVDELLFPNKMTGGGRPEYFQGMPLQSGLCFLMIGLSLLLLRVRIRKRINFSQTTILACGFISLLSIISHIYRVQKFYGLQYYKPMGIHTAFAFFFISIAILFIMPDSGIIKEFTSSNIGSVTARSIIPFAILVPIILGYLRLCGHWMSLFTVEFGVTFLVLSIVLVFVALTWYNALTLNRRDLLKIASDNALLRSEQKFRLLVSHVKDYAIFMVDPDGLIVSWNEGAESIKGYQATEILGKSISIFYTNDDVLKREPDHNLEMARKNGRYENEGWRIRKDGTWFWANVVFTAIYENKELQGFAKITRDITEQKRTQEQIAYMARLMEDTSDAIVSTDSDYVVRTWNRAAEILYGYTAEEVVGRPLHELLRAPIREDQRTAIRSELQKIGYWKGEVVHLRRDSEPLTVFISIAETKDMENEPAKGFVMVCRDITERKKMEEQLQMFNEELEKQVNNKTAELTGIFERITDAFIALDKNLCYTYLNKKAGELIHREPQSLIGKYVWDVFPDAVGSSTYLSFNQAMSGQQYLSNIDYYEPLQLWQENHIYPSKNGLSIFIRDISERIKSEKALKRSEETRKLIMQASMDAIVCMDFDGDITVWNSQAEKVFGWMEAEVIGKPFDKTIMAERHRPMLAQWILEHRASRKDEALNHRIEIHALNKEGIEFPAELGLIHINRADNQFFCAFIRDITERKSAEENLKQSFEDIQLLASHLQDVREEERTVMAREIHDELGQQLTGIKMDMYWLGKKAGADNRTEITERIKNAISLVDISINTVRRISTDLHPSILDDLGLPAAVEWYGQEFEKRFGVITRFLHETGDYVFPAGIATGLFRICQESLTNIARHAEAKHADIELRVSDQIELTIEDDGHGFDATKKRQRKSIGLISMRERALMMGGKYEITSKPDSGTLIYVGIPFPTSKTPN
ncbi:MAG: PAS domain S-box protein [Bacteroidota bacterium]|nr:PAS domain S-box protein [Bacteroidota bacterium]